MPEGHEQVARKCVQMTDDEKERSVVIAKE